MVIKHTLSAIGKNGGYPYNYPKGPDVLLKVPLNIDALGLSIGDYILVEVTNLIYGNNYGNRNYINNVDMIGCTPISKTTYTMSTEQSYGRLINYTYIGRINSSTIEFDGDYDTWDLGRMDVRIYKIN